MREPRCTGLVSRDEGRTLRRLASDVPADQAIVELGSHTGLSTCWMAGGAQAHVFAVDPWGNPRPGSEDDPLGYGTGDAVLEAFGLNIRHEGHADKVTPLRTTSTDLARIWAQPVGLLFIDAVHEYAHVKADVEAWAPHMARGSVIAFHDWTDDPEHPYEGVKRAIDEVGEDWKPLGVVGSLWFARWY